jgi:hypothetical protein
MRVKNLTAPQRTRKIAPSSAYLIVTDQGPVAAMISINNNWKFSGRWFSFLLQLLAFSISPL